MTKLVLGVPLGVILGYIVTAVFAKTINVRTFPFHCISGDGHSMYSH